ncbi:Asp-tRNA(Asn)/Glu-tRNA(Gln) amidotransferase subunit GatA [Candidatus Peregrinibacteria bacterium]|nr:Asp-tRNA(Asn)/Glu-tRNA(Gln) amidotransferase subunit GatA [Candidatus Peregrinibacteria bacterium]
MDFKDLTIERAHKGLLDKEFSCAELAKEYSNKAKKLNKDFNIYITLTEEEALKSAQKTDGRISKGEDVGVLAGIPCAIKDLFNTKGILTTCASRMLQNFVPPYDATAIKKLKDEGMVMIGKTNLDEFACGGSTEHSIFGPTKNPVNPQYVAGGSSGGSAAALAADTCLYSLGTDTGGSIRQPASFCGVVGLKVTYGRVSRSGVTSMASSFDTIGPFAKNTRDCALVLQKMAGNDSLDSTTPDKKVPDYLNNIEDGVKGLKIGIPKEYFDENIDKEVSESVMNAVKQLEKAGAKIVQVSLPATKYAVAVYYIVMPAELSANLARFDGIRFGSKPQEEGKTLTDYYFNARGEGFGDEIKRRIMIGTYVLSAGYYDAYYKKAQKVRTLIIKDFEDVFKKADVIIGPTAPAPAFRIGENIEDPLKMYLADALTIPASCAGLPALNVPCGKSKKGLPIGMQIIGPQFTEDLLLKVGRSYESCEQTV